MKFTILHTDKKRYPELLLLADEQESMIDRYLERGTVYVLADPDVKCQCVVTEEPGGILEIQNLATVPQAQRHGYGRAMVAYIAEQFRGRCTVLQVGTGDSPSTLGFYRSCGFVPVCRIANYFP